MMLKSLEVGLTQLGARFFERAQHQEKSSAKENLARRSASVVERPRPKSHRSLST